MLPGFGIRVEEPCGVFDHLLDARVVPRGQYAGALRRPLQRIPAPVNLAENRNAART
jgi:hypothetical protein